MRQNSIEAIIGALVLGLAIFGFTIAYSSTQENFKESYQVVAYFERIDGIQVGSNIKVAGVTVGRVASIELDPKTYQAKVALQLKKELMLPEDSSVEVASEGLLGGKYLALFAGGSEQSLKKGGVISHTQSSLNFEELVGRMFTNMGQSQPQTTPQPIPSEAK